MMKKLFLMLIGFVALSAIVFAPMIDTFAAAGKTRADILGPTADGGCGIIQEMFTVLQNVMVAGKKFPPNTYVNINVVPAQEVWNAGDPLNDVRTTGPTQVISDSNGAVVCQLIWSSPLTIGNYNIIGDVSTGINPVTGIPEYDNVFTESLDADSPTFVVNCDACPPVILHGVAADDVMPGKAFSATVEVRSLDAVNEYTVYITGEIWDMTPGFIGNPIATFSSTPVDVGPLGTVPVDWSADIAFGHTGLPLYEIRVDLCVDLACGSLNPQDPIGTKVGTFEVLVAEG